MTATGSAAGVRADLRRRLLAWYDRERRELPWRVAPGEAADPYRVWLSEIMLQQTTVSAVVPYFEAFLGRWPSVHDVAAADLDDVLVAWQGLGYYARARNLHACARAVCERHNGVFPDTAEALRRLPGIGEYTAAAIAAIAFGRRTAPVDGNVVRVLSRLHGIATPSPRVRAEVRALAERLAPRSRPGDFAQALMDLGATVCTPRRPRCAACPWAAPCLARAAGTPDAFPVRAAKRPRPDRFGVAFWITRSDGAVLLRRRPTNGLLGGLMEVPTTPWRAEPWTVTEAIGQAPVAASWRQLPGHVVHTFTHFRLTLHVVTAHVDGTAITGAWCPIARLSDRALPTLMRKVAFLSKPAAL